jgi:hypothetical protein
MKGQHMNTHHKHDLREIRDKQGMGKIREQLPALISKTILFMVVLLVSAAPAWGAKITLHPTGFGSVNSFNSITVGCLPNRWECTNDQPGFAGSGTPASNDGNTSNIADNAGNREMFSLDNGLIPAGSLVTRINVHAWIRNQSNPRPRLRVSYQRMGGQDPTPVDGLESSQIDNQDNPYTIDFSGAWDLAPAWSSTDIDDLEIGVLHTAG